MADDHEGYCYPQNTDVLQGQKNTGNKSGICYLVEAGGIEPPSVSTPPQGLHAYPALSI